MIWVLLYEKRINAYENRKIMEEFNKEEICFFDSHYVTILQDKNGIKYFYKNKEVKKPKKVWTKLGCMLDDHAKEILKALEFDKVKIINGLASLEIVTNKFLTAMYLAQGKIRTIKSLKVISDLNNINDVVESNFTYPVVLKAKMGSLGMGIYKIENSKELLNMTEQINLIKKDYEYLIQEYIEEGNITYRIVALGGEIKYVQKNIAQEDSFKSNYSIHKEADILELYDKEIDSIIKQIYDTLHLDIMGVDLIKLKDNSYIVCEINSNPGFKGINEYGREFQKELVEFVKTL